MGKTEIGNKIGTINTVLMKFGRYLSYNMFRQRPMCRLNFLYRKQNFN